MKIYLSVIFLIGFIAFNAHSKEIRNLRASIKLDLQGANGFDGKEGNNGQKLDCKLFEAPIKGNDGEDGTNGEVGEKGEDLFVYSNEISNLSFITVNQAGGLGGLGGIGGLGSNGCNGGVPGVDGNEGKLGEQGEHGNFYLLASDFKIPKTNNTKILSLTELEAENTVLSENSWNENSGLNQLINPASITKNIYYTFSKTKTYKVRLVWNTSQLLNSFIETKFALSVKDGKLDLKSYTGGFLEYKIESTPSGFDVIINKVIAEHRVQNLRLKRIKGSGIDLTLEVRQKFDPNVAVKTRFVIAMAIIENRAIVEQTGFYEVPASLVSKSFDRYYLTIGRLRIPDAFKAKGAKIQITLTVYREVQGQTRARGLEGIFKI